MKASKKGTTKPLSGEQQIKGFIAKYEPKYQRLIRSVRKALRKRFPTADELIYDYNNAFVIGYSPTERGSDSVVAIAAAVNGLRLVFNQGPTLPDPKKLLLGSGKQTRFIWVESVKTLALPEIEALMRAALDRAKTPLRPSGRGKLIIKPSSAKQRPRQKPRR
ncbi:hypothetical protein D4R75_11430 [bacterium]|nr:MAG: hypothetical protein D4R75_11430 [bacterium]